MVKHATLMMVAGALVVALVGTHAQQRDSISTLTAGDYLEIQQLASQYAYTLDTGAGHGQSYANLFAPDGSFGNAKGREALAKLAWQHMPEQGPSYVKHFIVNHAIEVTSRGVIGKEYVVDLMFGEGRGPDILTAPGVYHDEYVKTSEGWRFASRKYVASKAGQAVTPAEPPLDLVLRPLAGAPARRSGAGDLPLTAEDYLEIQQLVNRYPYALDTGAGTGQMYGNLFTPDGVFGRSIGRDAITKMAWQHMPEQGPRYTKHFLANHVIESTPDGVVGKEYVMVLAPGEGGKPTSVTSIGVYEDSYQKTGEGWRFKVRRFAGLKGVQNAEPVASGHGSPAVSLTKVTSDKTVRLTPLDYAQIRQLASSSAYAMDGGDESGQRYASLFAPDGVTSVNGRRYRGEKELAEFARDNGARSALLHFVTNQVIEPSPEGATGKSYLVQMKAGDKEQASAPSGGGYFEDVYSRTPQGWRFKSRTFHPSKAGV